MKNTIQKAKLNHIASIKLPSLLSKSDTQTTCNISVSSTATKQPGTNEHFRSIQFYTSHFFGKLPWGKGINRFKIEEYYCRPDTFRIWSPEIKFFKQFKIPTKRRNRKYWNNICKCTRTHEHKMFTENASVSKILFSLYVAENERENVTTVVRLSPESGWDRLQNFLYDVVLRRIAKTENKITLFDIS